MWTANLSINLLLPADSTLTLSITRLTGVYIPHCCSCGRVSSLLTRMVQLHFSLPAEPTATAKQSKTGTTKIEKAKNKKLNNSRGET